MNDIDTPNKTDFYLCQKALIDKVEEKYKNA